MWGPCPALVHLLLCSCIITSANCWPSPARPLPPAPPGLGDLANARALFERALTDTPADTAPRLWDAFLRFEYEVGTTAAIQVGWSGVGWEQRASHSCG